MESKIKNPHIPEAPQKGNKKKMLKSHRNFQEKWWNQIFKIIQIRRNNIAVCNFVVLTTGENQTLYLTQEEKKKKRKQSQSNEALTTRTNYRQITT